MKWIVRGLLPVLGIVGGVLLSGFLLFPWVNKPVPADPPEAPLVPVADVHAPAPRPAGTGPALLVRIQSLGALQAGTRRLIGLAMGEKAAAYLDRLLAEHLELKDLAAFDPARPVFLWASLGSDGSDASAILILPVRDEKSFLEALERRRWTVEENADGVYRLTTTGETPVQARFCFAQKHAFITPNAQANLARDQLPNPEKLTVPGRECTIAAAVRLDQFPEASRQRLVRLFQDSLAALPPAPVVGQSKAEYDFEAAVARAGVQRLEAIVKEGAELSFRLDLDPQAAELSAELHLTALPGTALAKSIKDLGGAKSVFAGAAGAGAAARLLVRASLPEELRPLLAALVGEQVEAVVKEAKANPEQQITAELLQVLAPSLKTGELDALFSLRGPVNGRQFTLVAGLGLQDGAALARTVAALVPKGNESERVQFPADAVGGVKIGRLNVRDLLGGRANLFGGEPVYFAIRPDAFLASWGPEGLAAIKEAAAVPARAAPPLQADLALARLCRPLSREGAEPKPVLAEGKDRLTLSLEGGDSLRLRLAVSPGVLQLVGQWETLLGADGITRRKPREIPK